MLRAKFVVLSLSQDNSFWKVSGTLDKFFSVKFVLKYIPTFLYQMVISTWFAFVRLVKHLMFSLQHCSELLLLDEIHLQP